MGSLKKRSRSCPGDLSDLRDEFDLNTDDPDMAIRYDNSLHQIAVQRKILRHVS